MKKPNPSPDGESERRPRRRRRRTDDAASATPSIQSGPVYGPVIGRQTIHGSQINYFGASPPAPKPRRPRPKPRKPNTSTPMPPTSPSSPVPPGPPTSMPAPAVEALPASPADLLPALRRTLVRLGLVDPAVALPAPFETKVGESEGATTHFLMVPTRAVPTGELFAAKGLPTAADYQTHWGSILAMRADGKDSAGLPLAGNEPSDGLLVFRDGDWAARTFRRLGLLADHDPLPAPRRVLSGIAGLSRVYLFHVARQVVIAKFDRPDRQAAEWNAISMARKLGSLPKEFVLPFPNNQPSDGVTVFPTFQDQTLSGDVLQLNELIIQRLLTKPDPGHVDRAMTRLQDVLRRLYSGGQHVHDGRLWRESHPELNGRSEQVAPHVQRLGLPLDPGALTWDLSSLVTRRLEVPNPLTAIPARLGKPAGNLFLSRTHGDLQSTNVLVGLEGGRPEQIAVIDLEKLRDHQPVVDDLVRLEADFIRSVFSEIARTHFRALPPERVLECSAQALVLALDALDGRPTRIPDGAPEVLELSHAAGRWIHGFRQWAWRLLTPPGALAHWPRDWFHGLLFYYLKALLRPLVSQDPLRLRLVLLGAALAEQTLRDMDAGHYDGTLRFPDQWPPGSTPSGPPPNDPNPGPPPALPPTPLAGGGKSTTVGKGFAAENITIVGPVHIY